MEEATIDDHAGATEPAIAALAREPHFSSFTSLTLNHQTRKTHPNTTTAAVTTTTTTTQGTSPTLPSTTSQNGAQRRKIPIHALPLPRSPSRRPWHPRHKPHAAPQSHQHARAHPDLRALARPGPQRNLSESVQNPRPGALRLPDPRCQR